MATSLSARGPNANQPAKLPSLMATRIADPATRQAIEGIREWLEVRLGARGDKYERAVLLREYEPTISAIQAALVELRSAGTTAVGGVSIDELLAQINALRYSTEQSVQALWDAILALQAGGGAIGLPIDLSADSDVENILEVPHGGTGVGTLTAYAPLFGGTTSTDPVQSGTVGTAGQVLTSNGAGALPTFQAAANPIEAAIIVCSGETKALTTGTAKVTFRMPYAVTLLAVRASLTTAQASGSIFTVDINENGTTILSTKLTIDNTEKTSTTAATAAVISDTALADDAEITIDVDQVGDGTGKGLKVTMIWRKT